MNKQRLLRLADHLNTVDPLKFNIFHWKWDRRCDSVACAIGHACEIPEFAEAGLHLVPMDDGLNNMMMPAFEDATEFQAAAKFFDITWGNANMLFYSTGYERSGIIGPKDVANRIRQFVEAGR